MLSAARILIFIAIFCQICIVVVCGAPKYQIWSKLQEKEEDTYQGLIKHVDNDFGMVAEAPKPKRSTRHLHLRSSRSFIPSSPSRPFRTLVHSNAPHLPVHHRLRRHHRRTTHF